MTPLISNGWLLVPYGGSDAQTVEIALGAPRPRAWLPAFLDWHGEQRVAKIRPPVNGTPRDLVWLRYGGTTTQVGRFPV